MEPLNSNFFIFKANQETTLPFVRDFQPYENWVELPRPRVDLANVRKVLPACIAPTQSGGPLLLREDVVRKIQEEKLSGLVAKEIEVVKLNGKKSFDRELPIYFWVTASGTMATTVEIYQRTEGEYVYQFSAPSLMDPKVMESGRDYGRFPSRIVPIEKKWDGSDFFNVEYKRPFGEINCTRRFVELAYQEKWDNLYFLQIDNLRPRGTDFRTLPWPPELWYPPYQPSNFSH